MPMESGAFFRSGKLIVNIDVDDIAPICFDCRPWKLIVDKKNFPLITVGSYGASLYCEVVRPNMTLKCISANVLSTAEAEYRCMAIACRD